MIVERSGLQDIGADAVLCAQHLSRNQQDDRDFVSGSSSDSQKVARFVRFAGHVRIPFMSDK
ncbi:MAG: hypothetical protein OXE94_08345 [Aestuariivita sp.]|nr:hypothetical protein [Aestuariivita sp.]MCY4202530.1 hypothetical protein [Aestuariivita sp.]MCY4289670.1 hypothetical protein [Aestuariivita sp.]MCY4346030.1 hypothetical protein [Aestuariivita sp.]